MRKAPASSGAFLLSRRQAVSERLWSAGPDRQHPFERNRLQSCESAHCASSCRRVRTLYQRGFSNEEAGHCIGGCRGLDRAGICGRPAGQDAGSGAAPVAYAPSWTGCYVGGGGGYGLWNQENTGFIDGPPRVPFTATTTAGGRGYLGAVGGGCDYQFPVGGWNFVVGAFADYDWSRIKGKLNPPAAIGLVGDEKESSAWAVGGRVGWLAFPSLLTYFTGGYTQATFDRTNLSVAFGPPFFPVGLPANALIDKKTYKGWFLGAGDEYAINFLPGLFWKTEYRFSEFDVETNPIRFTTGVPSGVSDDSKKWVHTIRSELVYRFNCGGPVAGRY